MLMNFYFIVPKSLQNLVENGQVVSERSKFSFSLVNDLGPGQEMTLPINTNSINCLHLLTFRSRAAIFSEKKIHCFHLFL